MTSSGEAQPDLDSLLTYRSQLLSEVAHIDAEVQRIRRGNAGRSAASGRSSRESVALARVRGPNAAVRS